MNFMVFKSWDGEVIPDYLGGLSVIKGVLKSGRGRGKKRSVMWWKDLMHFYWLWRKKGIKSLFSDLFRNPFWDIGLKSNKFIRNLREVGRGNKSIGISWSWGLYLGFWEMIQQWQLPVAKEGVGCTEVKYSPYLGVGRGTTSFVETNGQCLSGII